MDKLTQSKIFDTSSPPNIYSATIMRMVDGNEMILMVSSKTDIITLESKIVNDEIFTSIVKLDFSNIPSKAEIISIHCVNKSKEFNDFVIGLTYELNIEDQDAEKYLNIYSGYPGSSLESIMKNCKTLKLNFSPFQLNHAIHLCGTQRNGMWLLSGNDKKIHTYKIDKEICEQKTEEYFIEFKDTKDSNILCFSTKSFSDYKRRISSFGCDSGLTAFTIVDSEKNEILHCFLEHYQSPIVIVELFNIHNRTVNIENILSAEEDYIADCNTINEKEPVCLLVGSVLECAVVYMDVLKNHLGCGFILPNSGNYNAISTSLIADINFDSQNEILLGTQGNRILNYVFKNNKWEELQSLDIRHPVYTISYLDITGEGLKDAVIMSERGIHIFKYEPRDIIQIIKNRLKSEGVKKNRKIM